MTEKEKLLEVLNKLIKVLDPISFDDLNMDFTTTKQEGLLALEKEYPKIVLKHEAYDKSKGVCSSVVALIATITDILVGERLAFTVDQCTRTIIGFQWYDEKS